MFTKHPFALAGADSLTSCIWILNSIQIFRFIPDKPSAVLQTSATIQQPASTGLIHCILEELRISADIIPSVVDYTVDFQNIADATCAVRFVRNSEAVKE